MKIPPGAVIELMAFRVGRMHHNVWRRVRKAWRLYPDEIKQKITELRWEPPRPAFYAGDVLALDNQSGEVFLYRRRRMIAQAKGVLQQVDDPNYPRVEGWPTNPSQDILEFPVSLAWDLGYPAFNQRLQRVKSPRFLEEALRTWERRYLLRDNLRRPSLGQLGMWVGKLPEATP